MTNIELIDFPKPWPVFWTAMSLSLCYAAFAFFRKWRTWSRGMAQPSLDPVDYRGSATIWLTEIFLQRQLFALSFSRWLVHILIFYGFIGLVLLSIITQVLAAAGYLDMSSTVPRTYLHPEGYLIVKIWGDSFGLILLIGLVMAGLRRFVLRPSQQINNQADVTLLGFLLLAVLSGFALEGLRLALAPPEIARFSFVGHLFSPSGTYTTAQLQPWLTACWTFHFIIVAALFVYLPHSKLMHSILAPVIITMNAAAECKNEELYWPDISKYKATRSPRD
jgi:nitrate reductase gamma subunit